MIPRTAKGAKGKLKDVKLGKENFLECPRGRVQLSRQEKKDVEEVLRSLNLGVRWELEEIDDEECLRLKGRRSGCKFPFIIDEEYTPECPPGKIPKEPDTESSKAGAKPSTTSPRKGFKSPAPGKNEGGYSKFDRKDYIPPPPVPATDEERAELEGMVARLQDYQVDELMDRFQGRTDETTQEVVIDIDRMNVDRRRQFRAEIERLLNEKDTVDTRSHASSPPGS
ncbi:unnamed protein product [Effrenium voratum]|uniref:Uncharacterized protein n=1 Tax=Effrenium voratum TaxID=2562239 RepID=A0AA36IP30_9DINO|nr:unnamed protein product [Effrenium voratum]CAJ1430256.1 unnamed protein product [Effrenium voratum]